MAVGVAHTASGATPPDVRIERTVRALLQRYPLRALVLGVWRGVRRLAGGVLGESQPGVLATTADHFRIGNVTESFTTTLLLGLVDQRRLRLDHPLSATYNRNGRHLAPEQPPNLPVCSRPPC
jgi:CubicO group peptidase (beta-lactamase class C family)